MDRAVVLCSGGLNSAVTSAVAQQEHTLAFLHVRFGHRAAEREAELFDALADHFAAEQRLTIDMPHLAAIGGNARLDPLQTVAPATAAPDRLAQTHVPGLMATLLAAGYTWADSIRAVRVFLGVSENLGPPAPRTASIWPDYSREFIHLFNHLNGVATVNKPIAIDAPLIDLERTEIIQLGRRLEVPFECTWSCLASGTEPCGQCLGCATRARGFLDAGLPDPLLLSVHG